MVWLLYRLFRDKNIMPWEVWDQLPGRKAVVTAFLQYEAEERGDILNG